MHNVMTHSGGINSLEKGRGREVRGGRSEEGRRDAQINPCAQSKFFKEPKPHFSIPRGSIGGPLGDPWGPLGGLGGPMGSSGNAWKPLGRDSGALGGPWGDLGGLWEALQGAEGNLRRFEGWALPPPFLERPRSTSTLFLHIKNDVLKTQANRRTKPFKEPIRYFGRQRNH